VNERRIALAGDDHFGKLPMPANLAAAMCGAPLVVEIVVELHCTLIQRGDAFPVRPAGYLLRCAFIGGRRRLILVQLLVRHSRLLVVANRGGQRYDAFPVLHLSRTPAAYRARHAAG
jgi:hypothetical protein